MDQFTGNATVHIMQNTSRQIDFSLRTYFNWLLCVSFGITIIPYAYNISGIGYYGYGYSVGGVILSLMSVILTSIFWIRTTRWRNPFGINFTLSRIIKPRNIWMLSWLSVPLYVYFVFVSRIQSGVNLLDVQQIYLALGPTSNQTPSLSPVGGLSAILAPISLLLIPYAIQEGGRKGAVFAMPAIIFIASNLMMGKRQLLMFAFFLTFFSLIACGRKFKLKKVLMIVISLTLFMGTSIYFGLSRSGFTSYAAQATHNSQYLAKHVPDFLAFLGLLFLYTGGGAEVLSVATDHFEPTYLPFSVTNSFLLRRINGIMDYVNYEQDVVPYTSGVLETYLGSFGRIWAGGNLQLFAEGGYFLVIFWYLTMIAWFRYIHRKLKRGSADVTDLSMFGAVIVHHLFVFPLRDQLIFFAFVYYVLINISKRVKFLR